MLRACSPIVLNRVLGRGGSSSRMIRRTSSNAACFSRSLSNGVVPVSSSYSSTPRLYTSLRVSTSMLGHLRLLGAHVQRRADHLREVREQRLLGELLTRRLGDAEVDHLRHRHAFVQRDQHVRRLDVAVDDAFRVRVLHGAADLHEQLQPLARRQLVSVAELGDRHAVHQLHHEVRPARVGGAGVEHLGDVLVVHQRQRLALGLEAGDHLARVDARLDHLERDLAADGVLLLGHVDDAEPALADALQELVAADDRADALGRWRKVKRRVDAWLLHHHNAGKRSRIRSARSGCLLAYSSTDGRSPAR